MHTHFSSPALSECSALEAACGILNRVLSFTHISWVSVCLVCPSSCICISVFILLCVASFEVTSRHTEVSDSSVMSVCMFSLSNLSRFVLSTYYRDLLYLVVYCGIFLYLLRADNHKPRFDAKTRWMRVLVIITTNRNAFCAYLLFKDWIYGNNPLK